MAKTTDVAIIGGGVIGCSIAYQLSKNGVECLVFEQNTLASGASGASVGIVGPIWYLDNTIESFFELGMQSLEIFPSLSKELLEAGFDPQFHQTGVIKVALDEQLFEMLQNNLAWQGELGIGIRWLDQKELVEREPEITKKAIGGVFSPKEGSINGKAYVNALARASSRLGSTFLENKEVTSLAIQGKTVIGVRTKNETYHANHTILATGAWSGINNKWLPESIPVRPVKGQRILIRKSGFLPKSTVQSVVPQLDGSIIVGATREENRFDQKITTNGISQMLSNAKNVFPILNNAEFISATAGIRPGSPDNMPILGPVPDWEGITLATGHDHAGIICSPATGTMVARYILTGDSSELEPFSVNRFSCEKLKVAKYMFKNTSPDQ